MDDFDTERAQDEQHRLVDAYGDLDHLPSASTAEDADAIAGAAAVANWIKNTSEMDEN